MLSRLAIFVCFSLLVLGCGQAPAPPTAAGEPSAAVAAEPGPRVALIGLGDSITAGFGASDDKDYFSLLKNSLRGRFPRLTSLNLAMSGSTSLGLERLQLGSVPHGDRDTVGWFVITTGGNDLIHDYGRRRPHEGAMYGATSSEARPWIESFAVRMRHIVNALEADYPAGYEIFIANIYDPTDGKGDIEHADLPLPAWKDGLAILAAYNQVIAAMPRRDRHVHVVDLHGRFLGHGIHHGSQPYWYFINLEDPNDEGYAAIHKAFLEQMKTLPAGRATN